MGVAVGALLLGAMAVSCAEGESSAAQTSKASKTTPSAPAPRAPVRVTDEASFNSAIATVRAGDTIELADGLYPALVVQGRTFTGPVTIVGTRNAKLAGITFESSSNIVLQGVTVTPPLDQNRARIHIKGGSSKITIDGVLVDGRAETAGAFIDTNQDTSDVTIRNSDVTNCGKGRSCIRPGAANLVLANNHFIECRSCDFIKGGGQGATITGNRFDKTGPGDCKGGPKSCPHNDMIQIMGGGPWTIANNSFGEISGGAAQIYVNPGLRNADKPIHDIRIASNIFTGELGHAVRVGTGQKSKTPPPAGVTIVNNTFLSGRRSSVEINPSWDQVPADKHPVVANNIMLAFNRANCARGHFKNNLVLEGSPCPDDFAGEAKLDQTTAAPTAQSTLLIDRADAQYAPQTDFYGRFRKGAPDVGAIELGGLTSAPQVRLAAPAVVSRTVAGLSRAGWKLTLAVDLSGAETLKSTLLVRGRTVMTATQRVAGKARHVLIVSLPVVARRAGEFVLRIDATGPGEGNLASRSVRVRISR